MIRAASPEETRLSLRRTPAEDVCAEKIVALLDAYAGQPFFECWRTENGVAARLDGSFFYAHLPAAFREPVPDGSLAADASDELTAFFTSFPALRSLSGPVPTLRGISGSGLFQSIYTEWNVLTFSRPITDPDPDVLPDGDRFDPAPKLAQVYEVLSACPDGDVRIGPFKPWYVDMSHRVRHGCARAVLLRGPDGGARGCCVVGFETARAGILGVAVPPAFRGHGRAASLLRRTCADLAGAGKTPLLECTQLLLPYYRAQGFEPSGRTASLAVLPCAREPRPTQPAEASAAERNLTE